LYYEGYASKSTFAELTRDTFVILNLFIFLKIKGRIMGTYRGIKNSKTILIVLIAVLALIFFGAGQSAADSIKIRKADIKDIYDAGYKSYYDGNWVAAYANLTFCYGVWLNHSNFFDSHLDFKERLKKVIDYLKNHIQKCEPSSSGVVQYKHEMPGLPALSF
jgi:hypothetical protein